MKEILKEYERYEKRVIDRSENELSQVPMIGDSNLAELFEVVPVSLDKYLYDKEYLGIEKLSDKQYEFVEYGTQVYYEETLKFLGWDIKEYKSELVAEWGKGSGKDWCSAIIVSRVVHLLLCLRDPLHYYGQSKFSHIDLLNMAYSGEQAESNFFAYFSDMIKGSIWFKGKYKEKASRIEFKKKIRAFSGNSFEESFEGKNLLVCVLDEIAAFKTNDELEMMRRRKMRAPRYSADAVYDMAGTSVASRFPKGIGKVVALSFPRYKGDFIQQLHARGLNEGSCFVSFGSTWEVNPNRKREDFDDEYRKNPERSVGRYECKPSEKIDAYFKRPELIAECFKEIEEKDNPVTDDRFPVIKDWFKAKHSYRCAMHIDLGWKICSAGISMAHCSEVIRKEEVELPVVEVDLVTSVIAPVGGEIDFEKVRDFVLELVSRGFNLRMVTLDGYNSIFFLQTFAKLGIETKLRSVERTPDAYDDLKSLIYEKRLRGYFAKRKIDYGNKIEERCVLKEELMGLVGMGSKGPEKRIGMGKDEADSLAGATQGALELGYSGGVTKDDISFGLEDRVGFSEREGFAGDREYLSRLSSEM